MDIRTEKTKRSIYNAFIEIRSKKELEKMTVKELCEKAQINKSTFYVYYDDIYDLSDKIENDIVISVVNNLGNSKDIIDDPEKFAMLLCTAYSAQKSLISTVFSGIRTEQLPRKIEKAIKSAFFEVYPDQRENSELNMKLSFCIYGGYYAFNEYRNFGEDNVVEAIGDLSARVFGK